jgi:hypothetical protein
VGGSALLISLNRKENIMAVMDVIERTNDIIRFLERPTRTAWSNALRDSIDMLKIDPQSKDALQFLYDACTKAKGLTDIWVDGLTEDDWLHALNELKYAIKSHRESGR